MTPPGAHWNENHLSQTPAIEHLARLGLPQGLMEAQAQLSALRTNARDYSAAQEAIRAANTTLNTSAGADPIAYDQQLEQRATALSQVSGTARQHFDAQLAAAAAAITARRRAIAPAVAREQRAAAARAAREARAAAAEAAREQREAAHRAALTAVCGGTPPVLSAWDGELVGSESYLRQTANDPDSIDVEHCTQPILTERLCWVTTCRVRGSNAFGARILRLMRFSVGANHEILGASYVD